MFSRIFILFFLIALNLSFILKKNAIFNLVKSREKIYQTLIFLRKESPHCHRGRFFDPFLKIFEGFADFFLGQGAVGGAVFYG